MDPVVAPGHEIWAHPVAVLAIPAFVPVVVVIVTVLWVARRDRLAEARELSEAADTEGTDAEVETDAEGTDPDAPSSDLPDVPRRRWRDRMPSVVIVDERGDDHELKPRE
ncbi:hypothetical protein [Aeromicrobium alkaliterrae]|uniref:Transmembrane protein n=1 Tax=Aeromicrobium alkaliterrae TaxID=302168 RepID=A0ABN2JV85_9ACTN